MELADSSEVLATWGRVQQITGGEQVKWGARDWSLSLTLRTMGQYLTSGVEEM